MKKASIDWTSERHSAHRLNLPLRFSKRESDCWLLKKYKGHRSGRVLKLFQSWFFSTVSLEVSHVSTALSRWFSTKFKGIYFTYVERRWIARTEWMELYSFPMTFSAGAHQKLHIKKRRQMQCFLRDSNKARAGGGGEEVGGTIVFH